MKGGEKIEEGPRLAAKPSDFLSTANLIGSYDAPTVKGEPDWTMLAGTEQAASLTWLGMMGKRQELGQIFPYKTLSWNR